jgi:hypothetical protein
MGELRRTAVHHEGTEGFLVGLQRAGGAPRRPEI